MSACEMQPPCLTVQDLTIGLAGGGPKSRTSFIMDNIDVPQVSDRVASGLLLKGISTLSCKLMPSLQLSPTSPLALICLLQVINEMAAQTLVLNMDRCTKNFYVYRNPDTKQW